MAIGYLDSQSLTNIADAIRAKAGTSGTMTVSEMPANIAAIPSSAPLEEKDVTFYDYDGTILYSYTLAEAHALTAMPALPEGPTDYTAVSWTESLSYVQNLTHPWNVGVNYSTTRTDSWFYITVPADELEVTFMQSNSSETGRTIDWGDGTVETVGSPGRKFHTYQAGGDYIVKTNLRVIYGGSDGISPYGTRSCPWLVTSAEMNSCIGQCYSRLIRKAEIGTSAENLTNFLQGAINCETVIIPYTFAWGLPGFSYSGIRHFTVTASFFADSFYFNCPNLESIVFASTLSTSVSGSKVVFGTYPGSNGNEIFTAAKLRRLLFPDTVTSITTQGALGCLYSLKVFYAKELTSTANHMLMECESLEEVYMPKVTVINRNTFTSCLSLRKLTFNSGTSSIGRDTFRSCVSLQGADLSGTSLTLLDQNLFNACSNLGTVILPATVTSIGTYVFQSSGLKAITVPSLVTSIGNYSFYQDYNLRELHMKPTAPPTLGSNVFSSTPFAGGQGTIYVPQGHLNDYQTASGWSTFANLMVEEA